MQKNGQTITAGSKSPLRYRIKPLLAEMMPTKASGIKKAVRDECKVSRPTLCRYLNERRNTASHMSADVLQSFARHMALPMESLVNR